MALAMTEVMSTSSKLQIVGAVVAIAVGSEALADKVVIGITLTERPGHVTEGTVTIEASPAEIYALVTDYANWPTTLKDVQSVKVEAGGRRDARVRFRSAALENEVTVVFDNEEGRAIRFRGVKGPPGGRARGAYLLTPIDGGKRTLITANLYMDVVGVPSLFVSDRKVRSMRHAKLTADLDAVARWFIAHRSSPQASR